MELNKYMLSILNVLLLNHSLNISELSEKTGIKKNNIKYTLDKLNNYLNLLGLPQIAGESYKLRPDELSVIKLNLDNFRLENYVLAADERKTLVFLAVALSPTPVSVDSLEELLNVSRNTVLGELSALKSELRKDKIELSYANKIGYRLCGDEMRIRQLIFNIVQEDGNSLFYRMQTGIIEQYLHADISETMSRIKQIFIQAESRFKVNFSSSSLRYLTIYIIIIHLRNAIGAVSVHKDNPDARSALKIAQNVIEKLNWSEVSISLEEAEYVACIVMGTRMCSWDPSLMKENRYLMKFTEDLLDVFEMVSCVTLYDRTVFEKQLFTHILPMYYRLKYRIPSKNPLLREIKQKYRELYNLTDLSTKYIEEKYKIKFTPDEIAYLSVYMGGWILAQSKDSKNYKEKILVICGEGVGTSIFVRQQIAQLLGDSYNYETIAARYFKPEMCCRYKMVATTVELPMAEHNSNNIIYVSPVLSLKQKYDILSWAEAESPESPRFTSVLEIIKKYCDVKDESALLMGLASYMHEPEKDRTYLDNRLMDLLLPNDIQIFQRAENIEDMVLKCCGPFVKSGIADLRYSHSIMEILREYGLYCQIHPGLLLLHGRPDAWINSLGITFTVLREPVILPGGEKINMAFTLASPDSRMHGSALKDILDIVSDSKLMEQCRRAGLSDAGRIYKLFYQKLYPQGRNPVYVK